MNRSSDYVMGTADPLSVTWREVAMALFFVYSVFVTCFVVLA